MEPGMEDPDSGTAGAPSADRLDPERILRKPEHRLTVDAGAVLSDSNRSAREHRVPEDMEVARQEGVSAEELLGIPCVTVIRNT